MLYFKANNSRITNCVDPCSSCACYLLVITFCTLERIMLVIQYDTLIRVSYSLTFSVINTICTRKCQTWILRNVYSNDSNVLHTNKMYFWAHTVYILYGVFFTYIMINSCNEKPKCRHKTQYLIMLSSIRFRKIPLQIL